MMAESLQDERDLLLLRRYLLGQLDTETRDQVEARLFSVDDPPGSEDERFAELLQVAEDEIVDDYQFGNASYEDRNAMALCFSWTMARREKLQLATNLTGLAEASDTSLVTAERDEVMPEAGTDGDTERRAAEPWRLAGLLPSFGRGQAAAWTIPTWAPAAAALLLVFSIAIAFQAGPGSSATLLSPNPPVRGTGGGPTIDPEGKLVQLDIGLDEHDSYYAELYQLVGTDYQMIRTYGLLPVDEYEGTTTVPLSLPIELAPAGSSYYVSLYGVTADEDPLFIGRFNFAIED